MSKKLALTTTLALFALAQTGLAQTCRFPAPSQNFTRDRYSGEWYEIAKFQTAGGAYFEKDCVCTQLNVTQGPNGAFYADNICRNLVPEGNFTNALGNLFNEGPAGRFKEQFFPFAPSVDYTILLMGERDGEEYSVEYDCGTSFLTGTNYCVHFLARKPTMSEGLLQTLVDEVNALDLNYEGLPLQMTKQEGCWKNAEESMTQ
ncbi:hypothetical protein FGO68_gene15136 [Halteria grandinella]|uniref:Lipocalin/cytosolic fatty-acid binding domain-containing protein n=1 Tax=Halteria grandinella TaxID=5974 RepID=A0A8J8NHW8_HALGN|nr:hypothetical protein FGO68_gene15136 [Halteria grandinella]